MKSRLILAAFAAIYVPYVAPYILLSVVNPAGNPGGDSYVGQPGSAYDAKANPPAVNGEVTYSPPTQTQPMSDTPVPNAQPSP